MNGKLKNEYTNRIHNPFVNDSLNNNNSANIKYNKSLLSRDMLGNINQVPTTLTEERASDKQVQYAAGDDYLYTNRLNILTRNYQSKKVSKEEYEMNKTNLEQVYRQANDVKVLQDIIMEQRKNTHQSKIIAANIIATRLNNKLSTIKTKPRAKSAITDKAMLNSDPKKLKLNTKIKTKKGTKTIVTQTKR